MDKMESPVAVISSKVLTATFPNPPVVVVTAGRSAPALAACTPPAISNPAASASTG